MAERAPFKTPPFKPFKTMVLLCDEADRRNLTLILKRHRPQLKVVPAATPAELAALPPALLAQARMLSFANSLVVPAAVLDALGYGAYNFHPGPPGYPGRHAESFALYQGARVYGATAHVMREKVDSGPIVDIELFDVPDGTTIERLSELSFGALVRLFWRLAEPLATRPEPLPELPIPWSGVKSSRRRYAELCDIAPDIAKDELIRRVAAFGRGDDFPVPTVTLHGFQFRLVRPK